MGVIVVPTLEGYSKDLIRHTEKMGMVLDTWEVLGEWECNNNGDAKVS